MKIIFAADGSDCTNKALAFLVTHENLAPVTLPMRMDSGLKRLRKSSRRGKGARAQLIVMGTHGHSPIGQILMGSVAQRVVAECDVPVLLVK